MDFLDYEVGFYSSIAAFICFYLLYGGLLALKILCCASVWSMTEKLLKLLINLDLRLVPRFYNFGLTERVVLAMHAYYSVAECLMSFYKEQIS